MNTSSFNSFEAYQRKLSMEQRPKYAVQTQSGELTQNFITKLQLNSNQKLAMPANLNEIRHDGPKGQVQQLMTGGRKTPQHQQYFASTMNSLDQRVAFKKQKSGPVLMPEILLTSTVTTATKHLALEQFNQIQAHIQRRGFESLNSKQFESHKDVPIQEFESCFNQIRDKENRNEQVFRHFGGQDDKSWLRKQTMEAQDQFRALAQACKEDFSMPMYMHQPSHPEQVKHSVIGQGPNLNSNIYNESPFEHSVPTNRDSKTLASNSKTDGQFPFSFGTFSMVTSAGVSQVDALIKNQNLRQNFEEKDQNWSAANNARCTEHPFLQAEQKSRRLTEIQKGSQLNKKKFKASLGPQARNSNSFNEGRVSNTSTSSCGSITKSNKTIRKNKQKINLKRRESMPGQAAVSETRQILVKNNKIKFQAGSLNRRSQLDKGHKAIAGKRFIAQQPQLDCGGTDDEPRAENDMDDDQVFGIAKEDSQQSSQGLFVGAGLHFGNSQEDEAMVDQKWLECDSSDDELIKPTNTNKFKLDPENGGGRIHRLHNVSRIAHLKNGKEGLKSCVIDLFGCRQQRIEDIDESNIMESEEKSLPFSRISEEKLEESPPTHSSMTQHMQTGSSASNTNGFKLKPRNCGAPYLEQYSSGRMRTNNFDCNQNSDIQMNTKSSKSSTQRKLQDEASNRKAMRPNFHNMSRTTPFDQQQRIGDGIMTQDDKIRSLNKVLDEAEADQEEDIIDFALLQADDQAKFLELQPFDNDKQTIHNVITAKTLAKFITDGAVVDGILRRYLIVDCRFPFEFQGGHIQGAINICTPDDLESNFFQDPTTIQVHLENRTILIFHCEHSQNRAPNMLFSMRNLDRHMNSDRYPQIFYPESYLLEGGYQKFYNEFPKLCKDKYVQGSQGGDVFEQMMHCTIKKQKSYNAKDKAINLRKQQSFNMIQKHPAPTHINFNQQLHQKKMRSESQHCSIPSLKLKLHN